MTKSECEMTSTTRPAKKESEKIFVCKGFSPCNMGFSRSEHLNRHRRKHTGEKPYACTYRGCLRSFSRYDNMKQHLNTHKDNKSRGRRFCTLNSNNNNNVKTNQKKVLVPNLTNKNGNGNGNENENENLHYHNRNYSNISSSTDHSCRENSVSQSLSPSSSYTRSRNAGPDSHSLKINYRNDNSNIDNQDNDDDEEDEDEDNDSDDKDNTDDENVNDDDDDDDIYDDDDDVEMKNFDNVPRTRQLSERSNSMPNAQLNYNRPTLPPLRPRHSIQLPCIDHTLDYCKTSKEMKSVLHSQADQAAKLDSTICRLVPITSNIREYTFDQNQSQSQEMIAECKDHFQNYQHHGLQITSLENLPTFPLTAMYEPHYSRADSSPEESDFVQEPRRRLSIKDLCEPELVPDGNRTSVGTALELKSKKARVTTDDYEAALSLEKFRMGT